MANDTKNSGFVAKLALVIAVIALLWNIIGAFGESAGDAAKKAVSAEMKKASGQLDQQVQRGIAKLQKLESDLRVQELQNVKQTLNKFSADLDEATKREADQIVIQVEQLEKKIRGEAPPK